MSETTLPGLPGEGDEIGDDALRGSQKRVLAFGAAVVLSMAAGGYVLLSGGSEGLDTALSVPPTAAPAAAPVPSPTATPSPTAQAVPAGVARDPFRNPSAVAAVAAATSAPAAPEAPEAPEAPAATLPAVDGGGSGEGAVPADEDPPVVPAVPPVVVGPQPPAPDVSAPTAPPPAADPTAAPAPRRLSLVRVSGDVDALTAVFDLDGASVPVAPGARFGAASDLLLVSVQQGPADGQWTAVVQIADREPFDVVSGSPVTVL